jgi:[acyl-carrier-protein] S-malonyltransferase
MKVLACPGQGSQSQGFLSSWIGEIEGFKEKLNELSGFCGLDLIELGTTASEESIKETEIAQPLIVGASIATARTALDVSGFDGVVGHSVGEIAASAIASVISDEQAMRLVTIRGRAMAKAAKLESTSMAAIIGGDHEAISNRLDELELSVANFNGAGQVVAAGSKSAIELLVAIPPAGCRVIELKVAGAFHTKFMAPAVDELLEFTQSVIPADPKLDLWSNVDGSLVTNGQQMLDALVSQVANPVRWDKCMESLAGMSTFVELPPAGALSGLVKRGVEGAMTVALKTPSDLEKIRVS